MKPEKKEATPARKYFCSDCQKEVHDACVYAGDFVRDFVPEGLENIVLEDEAVEIEFNKDGSIKKIDIPFITASKEFRKFVNLPAIEKVIRANIEEELNRKVRHVDLECAECGGYLVTEEEHEKQLKEEANQDETRLCQLLDEVQAVKERIKASRK
jgi:hypothetical protein